jgi:transposase
MQRHEITNEEWARLEALLPPERPALGRPSKLSNREFLNALTFIAKTGIQWRDLPERFGPWKTIYTRFSRWCRRGVFDRLLASVSQDADNESSIVDSSCVRVHQHAAGGKGGPRRNVLAALEAALPQKSMLSWTLLVTQPTFISPPAMSTMSWKHRNSSTLPMEKTLSPTKVTMRTTSSKRHKQKV